jgi:dipeptidyl aminopeptidase/acylaminoacyl peptidase
LLQPVAAWWVKWEVKKKSGLECNRVVPIEYAKRSNVPLLLGHSTEDELIPVTQARDMIEAYRCDDKKFVPFRGRHNDVRPIEWIQECLKFVEAKFRKALDPMSLRTTGEQRVEHMGNLDDFLQAMEKAF